MKKLYKFFSIGLITCVVSALLVSVSSVGAVGEKFSFSGSGSNSAGLGGSTITASGGAFSSTTTFTKGPRPAIFADSGNLVDTYAGNDDYVAFYFTNNINLKQGSVSFTDCLNTKAIIALKSSTATTGQLYIPYDTACASLGTTNGTEILPAQITPPDELGDPSLFLPANGIISIGQNLSNAYEEGYASALEDILQPLKVSYYQALGARAPCSSQGCNDSTWDGWVGECWSRARSQAADDSRYVNQGNAALGNGETYDMEAGIKKYFAICLADKTEPELSQAQITDFLKVTAIDYGAVNGAGTSAAEAAQNELDALLNPAGNTSTCNIPNGMGWILCPVFNTLADISDGFYSLIQDRLEVDARYFTETSPGVNRTEDVWSLIRNIANVGFVIVFLIVIFSQISSIGITNYGIKKTLPRLLIAALLVNISYYACVLAVDLSNVIGSSINNLLENQSFSQAVGGPLDVQTPFGSALTGVLGAGALAGTGVLVAVTGVGLFVPIILAAVLALSVTFFILLIREVAIILLVILSPLAFLAMLLPNTEGLFKQWRKIFISLLILYPAIALLFGGSKFVAGLTSTILAGQDDWLNTFIALGILVVPLFALPTIVKGSLNAIPAVGKFASNLQARANGLVGNKAKEFGKATPIARGMALRKQARENFRSKKFAKDVGKGGITGLMARGVLRYDKLPGFRKGAAAESQRALTRSAAGSTEKAEMEDINYERQAITEEALAVGASAGDPDAGVAHAAGVLEKAISDGDDVKARAAFTALHQMGQTGVVAATASVGKMHRQVGYNPTMLSLGRYMKNNHPDVKSTDNRLNKWAEGDASGLMAGAGAGTHLFGLRDREIATQSKESIENGQLAAADAARILSDDTLSKEFKPGARDALIKKAGSLYTGAGGGGPAPP